MRHQIADKPAGGLELLSRLCLQRIDKVVAQNVASRPLVFVAGQAKAFQRRLHGRWAFSDF